LAVIVVALKLLGDNIGNTRSRDGKTSKACRQKQFDGYSDTSLMALFTTVSRSTAKTERPIEPARIPAAVSKGVPATRREMVSADNRVVRRRAMLSLAILGVYLDLIPADERTSM